MQANIDFSLSICLLVSTFVVTADNLCHHFGPRSGGPVLDKTLFGTLIVLFLEEFVLNEEKKNTDDKNMQAYPT